MEIKKDCFAHFRGECSALKIIDCMQCSFYKTEKHIEVERQKARHRIEHLDQVTKDYIKDKYYTH